MLTILRIMPNLIISSLIFPHVRSGGKTGTLPQRSCKSWFTPLFTADVVNRKCHQIIMPKSVKCDLCDIRFEREKRFIDRVGSGSSQPPLDLWQKYEVLYCICICVFVYLSLAAFSLPWVCGRSRKLLSGKIRPLSTGKLAFGYFFCPVSFSFLSKQHSSLPSFSSAL